MAMRLGFLPASHLARQLLRRLTGATQTSGSGSGERRRRMYSLGEMVQVDKPKGAPEWMPAKIWKPSVKKVGMETLEEATAKAVVVKRTGK
jgi:hypothetical protein